MGLAACLPAQAATYFDLSDPTNAAVNTCLAGPTPECAWTAPTLRVNDGADIEITGTVADGTRILVPASATATITLNGVNISGMDGGGFSPLMMNTNATLTLNILGNNTLDASPSPIAGGYAGGYAGLRMEAGTTLTIGGTGTLTAKGGINSNGPGIGGRGANRAIVINSGTINATGGGGSAGIGGAGNTVDGYAGDITIHGGTITATGGDGGGPGIGNGRLAPTAGNILIDGGIVNAMGGGTTGAGGGGAGIGGGWGTYVDSITIIGAADVTAKGGNGRLDTDPASLTFGMTSGGGAGIGSGGTDAGTTATIGIPGNSITIGSTAKVAATGGNGALADPSGPTPGMYSGSGAGIGSGGASSISTIQTAVTLPAALLALKGTANLKATAGTPTGAALQGENLGMGGIATRWMPLTTSAAAVPTLNEWALMLLALGLAGMAGLHRKRGV